MKKLKDSDYDIIFSYLEELFPNADTELHFNTPFQLLVAVILSAQTTDKQVNKVTDKLFQTIKEPQDILNMGLKKFEKSINSINLYRNKAKYIYKTSEILALKNWEIPKTEEELIKLPWVWEKTAKVVVYVLYKKPVIAVDTHVHRVCNRLWIVQTKTALQTSKLLEERIPSQYKLIAHHCIILFGRYQCMARSPKCESCRLQSLCLYFTKNHQKKCLK